MGCSYALGSLGLCSLFNLFRMYWIIHPTEMECHSIWMLFLFPRPQLPTAFSLSELPREASLLCHSLSPRTSAFSVGLSLALHTFKSSSFQSSSPEFRFLMSDLFSASSHSRWVPLYMWVMLFSFSCCLDSSTLSS